MLRRSVADDVGEVEVGVASGEGRATRRHFFAVALAVDEIDVFVDVERVFVDVRFRRLGVVVGLGDVDGEAVALPRTRLLLDRPVGKYVQPNGKL